MRVAGPEDEAALPPASVGPERRRQSRSRRVLIWFLIVVASVIGCAGSVTVWAKRQALNTDQWVKASNELLANPTVRQSLATYLVAQVYDNVDVAGQLQRVLPPAAKQLAPELAGALQAPAVQATDRLLSTQRVQSLWDQLNRTAHQALVNVLEGHTRVGSTKNGVVTLELGTLVRNIGERLGLPAAALDKIPPQAGQIVITKSSKLSTAQTIYKVIKVAGAIAFVVMVALYLLAVYLSADRRRTVRNIGWALVVVALFLFVARRGILHYVTSLVTDPTNRPAASITIAIETSLLRQLAWAVLAYGLSIALWAVLVGPTRAARAVRRLLAPVVNPPAVAAVSAIVVFLLLVLWAPTPAFRTWFGVLGLAALFAIGVVVLRRATLAEFPSASLGETWAAVWARVSSLRGPRGTPPPPPEVVDVAALERLSKIHSDGDLSDEEYALAKSHLLNGSAIGHDGGTG